jgi:hypothetical protein
MKSSRTFGAALALIAMIGGLAIFAQAAPGIQGKKQEAKPAAKASSLPKEVAALIQEGLVTRQGRQDIPFTIFKQLALPAQGQNIYAIFFFKAKNGDLGYAPSATGSGELEASLNAYFQFFQAAEDGTLKPWRVWRAPTVLKTDGANYGPENEDWYSFGITLPAGKYTMAMALTTPDMKKMSVAYTDATIPGPESYATKLWVTDPVIASAVEQVEQEPRVTIHRGDFLWGALKIVPNILGNVAVGENLDIVFFILGGSYKDSAGERPVNEFEVNFEVQDSEGKPAIKWVPAMFDAWLVNQELPLFQTLQKMNEKGEVLSTDKKPLDPGKYVLAIAITDKVSGKKADTKLNFSVR